MTLIPLNEIWSVPDSVDPKYLPRLLNLDTINESSDPELQELKKLVDGVNILGIVQGCYFLKEGASLNKRWYSQDWSNGMLEQSKTLIESRNLLGKFDHEDRQFLAKDVGDGQVCLRTIKMWIDEATGLGMGRSLLVGLEPSGTNLYKALKAGIKLCMSTRAKGSFIEGKTHEGMPIVDPKTYKLLGIDVVLDPGIEKTYLQLVESYNLGTDNNIDNSTQVERSGNMDLTKLLEDVKTENAQLKSDKDKVQLELTEALKNQGDLKAEHVTAINERDLYKKQLDVLKTRLSFVEAIDESTVETLNHWDRDDWQAVFENKLKTAGDLREISYKENNTQYDSVFVPTQTVFTNENAIRNSLLDYNFTSPIKASLIYKKDSPEYGSNGIVLSWGMGQRPKDICSTLSETWLKSDMFDGVKTVSYLDEDDRQELEDYRDLEATPEELRELKEEASLTCTIVEAYNKQGKVEDVEAKMTRLGEWEAIGDYETIKAKMEHVAQIEEKAGSLERVVPSFEKVESLLTGIKEEFTSLSKVRFALESAKAVMLEVKEAQEDETEAQALEIANECNIELQEVLDILDDYNGNVDEANKKVFNLLRGRKPEPVSETKDEAPKKEESPEPETSVNEAEETDEKQSPPSWKPTFPPKLQQDVSEGKSVNNGTPKGRQVYIGDGSLSRNFFKSICKM